MNKLAIVICNYNGGEDTVKCVDAVQQNTYKDFDIFLVDNASQDDSIDLVINRYGNNVNVLYNQENLGGSGGFGRGLRHTCELGYEYIMVLDNDAFVDTDTIEKLLEYIKNNSEVGIVGAKIMKLDDKERIFDFAKCMDWEHFHDCSEWINTIEDEKTQKPFECDYVAATAAIIRRAVLVAAGGMDEEHFIYYDDIELCQRIKLEGYKVVCLGTAKAWHRSNFLRKATNTFGKYYMTRNKYRFFAKYLPEERLEEFADSIIEQSFPYMYGSHLNGREDMFLTYKYIIEDFMNDVRGKAREGRIHTIKNTFNENVAKLIGDNKKIAICRLDGARETTYTKLKNVIAGLGEEVEAYDVETTEVSGYDLVIALCDHVKDQHDNLLPAVVLDAYGNMMKDYETYIYFQNYDNALELLRHIYKPSILEGIQRIRGKS